MLVTSPIRIMVIFIELSGMKPIQPFAYAYYYLHVLSLLLPHYCDVVRQ
jgi:hypothetical protein